MPAISDWRVVSRSEGTVSLMVLLSGSAGLIFENVWLHRAGLVFGNTVWSTSVVLAAFMGGMALGSALIASRVPRDRSSLRLYGLLEAVVALSGVGVTYLLPLLPTLLIPLTQPFLNATVLSNIIRGTSAFTVLVVPASAMGATMPLLVGAVSRGQNDIGRVLGSLYGLNTLGAVLGVTASELFLVERFGIPHTAWIAGLLDLSVAAAALRMSFGREEEPARDATAQRPTPGRPSRHKKERAASVTERRSSSERRLLSSAFLTGCNLMALEVLWFRFLLLFVQNNTLSVALILGVVLTGIGAGGLLASAWTRRRDDAVAYAPVAALLSALLCGGTYAIFNLLTHGSLVVPWQRVLYFALVLTLPTSLLSGITFTLLSDGLKTLGRSAGDSTARLFAANTTGAMCGPLLAAFVLLPVVGTERSVVAIALSYVLVAVILLQDTSHARSTAARRLVAATLAVTVVGFVSFPFGLMASAYFPRVAEPYTSQGEFIVATHEGTSETILLMQRSWMGQASYHRLVTNGFPMTATLLPAKRYMRFFAYWPMLFHRGALQRALVICYGVGVTAGAVEDIDSIESIDVVDLSRDMVAMSDLVYAPDAHPLHDPRIRLHFEDGRYFLQTTSQRFDLITGEPPPPRTPGTVNLYTREYFQLIRERLNDGGTTTYWLPVARPSYEEVNVTAIIRAFCDVFEDCSLWNATPTDWMLVGTRQAHGPIPDSQLAAPWTRRTVAAHLEEVGFETPQQIFSTFLADAGTLKELTAQTPALTDDHPRRLDSRSAAFSISPFEHDPRGFYRTLGHAGHARQAFAASGLIRDLLPATAIRETMPYFQVQEIVDRILGEEPNLLRQVRDLNFLLMNTTLRSAPLWILGQGNHPLTPERLASLRDDLSGSLDYLGGLRALVDRDYARAVDVLGRALRRGVLDSGPPLVVALCLSGRCDVARELRPREDARDGDDAAFWNWVDTQFPILTSKTVPAR